MQIKENMEAPRHWPLCGEFTSHRWIPRTKGQLRGKCFHLMTSSWTALFCVFQPECIAVDGRYWAQRHGCVAFSVVSAVGLDCCLHYTDQGHQVYGQGKLIIMGDKWLPLLIPSRHTSSILDTFVKAILLKFTLDQWFDLTSYSVSTAWSNDLLASRNKPLPDPMLIESWLKCKLSVVNKALIKVFISQLFSEYTACHDDVIKWKHVPLYWSFVWGIHRSLVNSPHKGQWRGAVMLSFICAWINGWVNNREAGDYRRHRAKLWRHCDLVNRTEGWSQWLPYRHRGDGGGPADQHPFLLFMLNFECHRIVLTVHIL